MTKTEQQIWDLVHEWCNEQSCEIPDFNRRVLMERILALRQPLVMVRSEQLVAFLKWVGDGYDFENNAEKIVREYIDEGN